MQNFHTERQIDCLAGSRLPDLWFWYCLSLVLWTCIVVYNDLVGTPQLPAGWGLVCTNNMNHYTAGTLLCTSLVFSLVLFMVLCERGLFVFLFMLLFFSKLTFFEFISQVSLERNELCALGREFKRSLVLTHS